LTAPPGRLVIASPADVIAHSDELVEIYAEAFSQPPWSEEPSRVEMFRRHIPAYSRRKGFAAVFAEGDGQIVGFALGARLTSAAWWWKDVASRLSGSEVETWLADCYELIEIAVRPQVQGKGIGAGLHDRLFENVTTKTALLSTHPKADRALSLYRNRGWKVLIEDFLYSPVASSRLIMGLELPRS